MAFASHDAADDEVMSEINMTPLVDVMLVLLIVFMLTVPVLQQSIHIQLPRAAGAAPQPEPEAIRLAVDAKGAYSWNDQAIAWPQLQARLATAGAQATPPELQVRGDRDARYEAIVQVMAAARQAGLHKVDLVTEGGGPQH